MPFGLSKPDKLPEHESDPANEEAQERSQDASTVDPESSGPFPADQREPSGQPQRKVSEAMSFRPAFLDSDAPSDSDVPSERAPAAHPPPPKSDAFFVSVNRDSGIETHRFDGPTQAQTFVEQLLEEGVPQEEVTTFSGRRVALRVTHKPIVKLVTSEDD